MVICRYILMDLKDHFTCGVLKRGNSQKHIGKTDSTEKSKSHTRRHGFEHPKNTSPRPKTLQNSLLTLSPPLHRDLLRNHNPFLPPLRRLPFLHIPTQHAQMRPTLALRRIAPALLEGQARRRRIIVGGRGLFGARVGGDFLGGVAEEGAHGGEAGGEDADAELDHGPDVDADVGP